MKKYIGLLIVALLLMACQTVTQTPATVKMEVHVLKANHQELLVYHQGQGLIRLNSKLEYVPGDVLEIEFSGEILDSYPAQIGEVINIKKGTKDEHEILLYYKLIDDFIHQDFALASNIEEVSINIPDLEIGKDALYFLLRDLLEVENVFEVASFEALIATGKLETEYGGYEYRNGVYLEIKKNSDQQFKAYMFRSGLGAIWFRYEVQKVQGVYQLNGIMEAIS